MRVAAVVALLLLAAPADASQCGRASWYGPGFQGRHTANGERFNTHAMTCAHRTAKMGHMLTVRRTDTGATLVCRVNDRGPFVGGRIVDLSHAGAKALGMLHSGTAKVCVW